MATSVPVILAGDYSVVPTEFDIYPTNSWDDDAPVQPESRAAYRRLLDQGWTDTLRSMHLGARLPAEDAAPAIVMGAQALLRYVAQQAWPRRTTFQPARLHVEAADGVQPPPENELRTTS